MSHSILLVDDASDFLEIMRRVISKRGLEPLCARTADQAWEIFEAHRDQIVGVFSDMSMPGDLDGLALARNIRLSGSKVPFFLLSGKPQDISDPTLSPISQMLKPISLRTLRATIDTCIP